MFYVLYIFVLTISVESAKIHKDVEDPLSLIKQYYKDHEEYKDTKIPVVDKVDKNYDFIIIGSGSGGSVMANRLSEMTNWTVLLLEAGEQAEFYTDVPLLGSILFNTKYDWKFESEKETQACLSSNGICRLQRGKVLGGSSVINGNVYSRGNKKNFDDWEKLGNSGWSYKEILKYFKKSENIRIGDLKNSTYHGKNGYVSVEQAAFETPLISAFLESAGELNVDILDYNGKHENGFSKIESTLKNGRRCSAVKAFLKPASLRNNLSIVTSALVTKIKFKKTSKRASGVHFMKNGINYTVNANKEVILSAGSINSPQILMLSGVGPKKHLKELQIPTLKDLKVGHNLKDHLFMVLPFVINETITIQSSVLQNIDDISDYFERGLGPLTVSWGAEGVGFANTDSSKNTATNLEIMLISTTIMGWNYTKYLDKKSKPQDVRDVFFIGAMLLKPRSVGRIELKNKNPEDHPKITLNYFSHQEDIDLMTESIKLAVKVARTKAFAKYNATLDPTPAPGCEELVFESDEYWECAIRQVGSTLHHQVGTCKMGPASDPTAVVDHTLKVHGIKGLRVVDASIMPTIPAAHTNAVVYMIAEKAADMVKEEWLEEKPKTKE